MISILKSKAPKSSWAEKKAKFKIKFPSVNDTDLSYDENKINEMLDKLQAKTGRTTKELRGIIEKL